MVKKNLRILVCPLDWGIGHASRCVPVIRQLLDEKHEVLIAADGMPLDFLLGIFPELESIRFPGHKVVYPSGKSMALKMGFQAPWILLNILKEHRQLKKITREFQIDVVISDNRFGLWNKETYSVYMTHQVMIKATGRMRWAEPLLYRFHRWFAQRYNECWIPDLPGNDNLSGDLSHKFPLPKNGYYIGLLSRFKQQYPENKKLHMTGGPDLLVMLSGPEPQRTILENKILEDLAKNNHLNTVILRGLPGNTPEPDPLPGVTLYNHLPDEEIARLISQAGLIVCRPGYSTVMDLAVIGKSAVVVPTPGQTEQEYLARYLSENGLFKWIPQNKFSIEKAVETGMLLPGHIKSGNNRSLLKDRIMALTDEFGRWHNFNIPDKMKSSRQVKN